MIRMPTLLRRLRRDASAIALTEFALASPIFLILGIMGVESSNYALVSMKVSQIAANLADTASRIGQDNPLSLKQIRDMVAEMPEAEREWLPQFEGKTLRKLPQINVPPDTVPVPAPVDPALAINARFGKLGG